ncbi:FtsX-like permease family protein [Massilia arenosa]|uniref:FtsX-like permease family protein n=1 Tax=Zemynaea arenosa TaxID=2561931 RepID=A0A4Y9RV02_9BURK|nr:ABC transporter permease [Massilia arenosa]TFW11449.1 FtsX-like permease family protein [Massilia arenosa]
MFLNYLKTAWKVFMRRKLFTAINLLCIVITLVVLVVATALLEYTFFPSGVEGRSDRFVQIYTLTTRPQDGVGRMRSPLGAKLVDHYLRPLKTAEVVAMASGPRDVSVYQDGQVSKLQLRRVDANYWKIMDFRLLAGRLPNADDDQQGRFVAVLNQTTARRLFGSAPAVGQPLNAGGQAFKVIGVVEDAMHLNAWSDIWVPVTTMPSTAYRSEMSGEFFALLMAPSPAGVAALQADIARVARTVQFDDPVKHAQAWFWGDSKLDVIARMVTQSDQTEDSGAAILLSVLGIAMLLFMLLPALNLVNLNAGRIMERSGEIGVRKAFGATNAQLVGQFIFENVFLCLLGGLLALGLAQLVLMWINASQLIPYLSIGINLPVFGAGLLIAAIFGTLSGAIPAWKMSRMDPVVALKGVA